jgi:hypothetical protein
MRSETWLLRWLRQPGAGKELIRSREAFSCPQSLHGDKAVAPTLQPDCLRSPRDDWKPTCTCAFPQWRISGGVTARKVPGWVQSGACVRSEVGPLSHEKWAYGRSRLSEDHSPAARPVKRAAAGASV